jgi:hypothetical protein
MPPVASGVPPVLSPAQTQQTIEAEAVAENPGVVTTVEPAALETVVIGSAPSQGLTYEQLFGAFPPYDAYGVEHGTAAPTPGYVKQLVEAGYYDASVIPHYLHWAAVWVERRTNPAYAGTGSYAPASYDGWGGPQQYLDWLSAQLA